MSLTYVFFKIFLGLLNGLSRQRPTGQRGQGGPGLEPLYVATATSSCSKVIKLTKKDTKEIRNNSKERQKKKITKKHITIQNAKTYYVSV